MGAGRREGSWGCFSLEVVGATLHVPPALASPPHQRACSHGFALTSEGVQSQLCSDIRGRAGHSARAPSTRLTAASEGVQSRLCSDVRGREVTALL